MIAACRHSARAVCSACCAKREPLASIVETIGAGLAILAFLLLAIMA